MKAAVLLIIAFGLSACAPAPDECSDMRVMTYYERTAGLGWTGLKTHKVCIVAERRFPMASGVPTRP